MNLRRKFIAILILTLSAITAAGSEEERIFRTITASEGIADNSVHSILCTYTGRMTISTHGSINFYDGANFSHIQGDEQGRYTLDDYYGSYHLFYDNDHHLWLKSYQGVTCVNLTTEQYISHVDSVFKGYGAKTRVNDIYPDVDGNVWMSTGTTVFTHNYKRRFATKLGTLLQDLEVNDKQELILLFDDGSMALYNLNSGKKVYEHALYGPEEKDDYKDRCVHLLHQGKMYVIRSGQKGSILMSYDLKSRQWQEIMRQEFALNSLLEKDHLLYVASQHGYFTVDIRNGEIKHYPLVTLSNGRQMDVAVNAMEFDLQGGLWLGTDKRGLLYDTPLDAPFKSYSLNDERVVPYVEQMAGLKGIKEFRGKNASTMLIDSRHWTWVGTPFGLYMYTSPQAEPVLFSTKNGLLNNVIHAIIEDRSNNVWLSTSYGISCVQIEKNVVKQVFSYNQGDNVPNESFIDAKVLMLPNGDIAMQSVDHVVMFSPSDFYLFFDMKTYVMHPKMTKLMVNGVDVTAGDLVNGEKVLDKAITRTKEINLNYDQNSITLTFSALNYARPLQTYYKVRVRELDPQWKEYSYFGSNGLVDRRGLLHLPLLALKPGTYHIELLTSVVPHQYEGSVYEWVVRVNEPWWRTSGIMAIVGLAVMAMVILNFYIYNKNTRLRMRRDNEEDDMIRRIKVFVERSASFSSEVLSPTQEEIYGTDSENQMTLDDSFVEVMLKVMPFVQERNGRSFSMYDLSQVTEMDLLDLYEKVSDNIHKSPRALIRTMRIDQAARMLTSTDKSVEDIALECGFISVNYMIAKFYHKFKKTPAQYREEYH